MTQASARLTLLHLSDLHIGSREGGRSYSPETIRENILEDCLQMTECLGPPDLILITGDISYSGDRTYEFWQATEWIAKLCEHVKTERSRLFLIPGNHDIDRRTFDPAVTPEIRQALWDDPGLINDYLKDYLLTDQYFWPQLKSYAQFSRAVSATPLIDPSRPFWEHSQETALGPVRLLGLNSALLSFGHDSPLHLCLGKRQVQCLIDVQARDHLHLVLTHHPPSWLKDGKEFTDQLAHRPHLLFCGHIHQADAESVRPFGASGRLTFIAGAADRPGGDGGGHSYSWIRITRSKIEYYPRIWTASGRFVSDSERCEHGQMFSSCEAAALPTPLKEWLAKDRRIEKAETSEVSSDGSQIYQSASEDEAIKLSCGLARENMRTATEEKRLLGKALLNQLPHPRGKTIYFGPGTTVFLAFRQIWETEQKWFFECKVATSNDWILSFLQGTRAWLADRIELVGSILVPEYGSWVLAEKAQLLVDVDISVLGLSGLDLSGRELELRTCWQNQVRTIKLASLQAKRRTVFMADVRKLRTSQGCTFIRGGDFRSPSTPEKKYDLIIAGTPSQDTLLPQMSLDHTIENHTWIVDNRVMRWSWGATSALPRQKRPS